MASNYLSLYSVKIEAVKQAFGDKHYPRDPNTLQSPDGAKVVAAFEALCKSVAEQSLTLECYIDDEQTPELWEFVWSDWEPEDYFELPLSPYGTPAVTYKDAAATKKFIAVLEGVKKTGGYKNQHFFSNSNLDSLVAFLEESAAHHRGVFVFISE
jgi:hypothetical protein